MLRSLILATVALTMSVPAMSAPCRDAKGKFVKCPPKPVAKAPCRDSKGHFAKCK